MYIENSSKFNQGSKKNVEGQNQNIEVQSIESLEKEIKDPIIEGFGETEDCKISNAKVIEFLKNTFGSDIFQKIKIDKITKDNEYYITFCEDSQYMSKIDKLLKDDIIKLDVERGMLITESKEKYIKAEMFLEDVDNPEKLQHTFNVVAGTGINAVFGLYEIYLKNFGAKKVSDFDYLKNIDLSDEDKMQVYILSTLAHEITHQYESQLKDKNFDEYQRIVDEYKKIIEEEVGGKRAKFVSDYVLRHKEVYNSDKDALFGEDLAEAVRIYTINPDYLRENYPKRFQCIKNNFSFIKSGLAVELIREFSEYNNKK